MNKMLVWIKIIAIRIKKMSILFWKPKSQSKYFGTFGGNYNLKQQ